MARLKRHASGDLTLVAETAAERALLRHAARRNGEVVLLDAYYRVHGQRVLLPQGISGPGAERVRRALEQAAASHREAEQRRSGFRLVKG